MALEKNRRKTSTETDRWQTKIYKQTIQIYSLPWGVAKGTDGDVGPRPALVWPVTLKLYWANGATEHTKK